MELLYAQVPGARRCRGERIDDLDSKMLNIRRRGGESHGEGAEGGEGRKTKRDELVVQEVGGGRGRARGVITQKLMSL